MRRAAVVINPTKTDDLDLLKGHLTARIRSAGWQDPLWLETTREDPGEGSAAAAVRAGADVVFCYGGDGTVTSCAAALAGTPVPLAILPAGTGNLLVRNLGLPTVLEDGVRAGLSGRDRRIDVGRLTVDDGRARRFLVMAGVGFDAAMMADAPETLKARLGWPAYVVSALRHLGDAPVAVGLRLDGGERQTLRVRTVLVGNVGRLQGGLQLLPDARVDDGRLDVVTVTPRHLGEWARLAVRVALRRTAEERRITHFQARTVEIRLRPPQPAQVDGDVIGDASRLLVEVEPGALLLRVPAR